MEKGRKRPPAAFNLGGIPAEHSWNVLLRAESSEPTNQRPPFSIRRFYTNQRRVDREK